MGQYVELFSPPFHTLQTYLPYMYSDPMKKDKGTKSWLKGYRQLDSSLCYTKVMRFSTADLISSRCHIGFLAAAESKSHDHRRIEPTPPPSLLSCLRHEAVPPNIRQSHAIFGIAQHLSKGTDASVNQSAFNIHSAVAGLAPSLDPHSTCVVNNKGADHLIYKGGGYVCFFLSKLFHFRDQTIFCPLVDPNKIPPPPRRDRNRAEGQSHLSFAHHL